MQKYPFAKFLPFRYFSHRVNTVTFNLNYLRLQIDFLCEFHEGGGNSYAHSTTAWVAQVGHCTHHMQNRRPASCTKYGSFKFNANRLRNG